MYWNKPSYIIRDVRENPYRIQYIKNPSIQIIELALSIDPTLPIPTNHLSKDQINYLKLKYNLS